VSATPLLECFQRGDIPRDVRMLAAQGALAPRADEQLALLVHLAGDADEEVAQAAAATIETLPVAAVAGLIARSDVADPVRAFFVARGVTPAAQPDAATDRPLIDTGGEVAAEADETARVPLHSLSVPARLKVAMKGSREQRAVLVRDPNRIIATAVLSSPKLTETEVEAFARMSNVSEDVLRIIGTNRAWIRRQSVASALVKNPKTPIALSLGLLPRMTVREVKQLSIDRNVPEALRLNARKLVVAQQSRQQ
jgi:hypothetical protein